MFNTGVLKGFFNGMFVFCYNIINMSSMFPVFAYHHHSHLHCYNHSGRFGCLLAHFANTFVFFQFDYFSHSFLHHKEIKTHFAWTTCS